MLSTGHADEQLQTNRPAMCQREGMWEDVITINYRGEREVDQRRAAVTGCCSDCDCEDETNRYK